VKRVLEVVAIALLVAGIEMATGAISYGLDRVAEVFRQLGRGGEPGVPAGRFLAGLGLVALGVGVVSVDVWARAHSGQVGRGRVCPQCGEKMDRVRRKRRHRLLGWILGERLTHRVCPRCGWSGLTGSF
jgi:predicted RNA-binding Zn-ribbon protein involved in translation (DUF1610 family)